MGRRFWVGWGWFFSWGGGGGGEETPGHGLLNRFSQDDASLRTVSIIYIYYILNSGLSCSVRPDVSLTSADVRPQVT